MKIQFFEDGDESRPFKPAVMMSPLLLFQIQSGVSIVKFRCYFKSELYQIKRELVQAEIAATPTWRRFKTKRSCCWAHIFQMLRRPIIMLVIDLNAHKKIRRTKARRCRDRGSARACYRNRHICSESVKSITFAACATRQRRRCRCGRLNSQAITMNRRHHVASQFGAELVMLQARRKRQRIYVDGF